MPLSATAFFDRIAPYYGEQWTIEEETRVAAGSLARDLHPSLLTPRSSLLTPRSSLLTPRPSLLTPRSSLLTPRSSLLTPRSSLLTPHSSLILEIGCGNGRTLRNLPRGAVGLDFSLPMLLEARARVPGARLVQGEAHRLPFRRGAFIAIVAVNVIHNIPEPGPVLAEIAASGARRFIVDFRNRLNPVVCWREWRFPRNRVVTYRPWLPWRWRAVLAARGIAVRASRPIRRPVSDPTEGLRLRHLAGFFISLLPGLAPCYCLLAEMTGPRENA